MLAVIIVFPLSHQGCQDCSRGPWDKQTFTNFMDLERQFHGEFFGVGA